MDETAEPEQFWYNLKTNIVEKGRLSAAIYRVGPFETEAQAANALALIRQRAADWKTQEAEED